MVEIREIDEAHWRSMRDVRLEALRDAPYAFASTYAREIAFVEADWQRRITGGGNFLALAPELDAAPVGIVGGFVTEPGTIELVSLWVRARARGHGVGAALVGAVLDWARAKRAARVHLWVTQANDSARLLYERCGFCPTGERRPLPSDPGLIEIGMARST
jgi:GNAT superfamily N-acetyltransferase